jgi:hypothetical protein
MANPIVLHDVTDSTWRQLQQWPFGKNVPAHPSALCLRDIENCKRLADREADNSVKFALPPHLRAREVTNWDPIDFKGQALHLLPTNEVHKMADGWLFVGARVLEGDRLHLVLDQNISAHFKVRVFRVEYANATHAWPMLVTVAIPNDWSGDKSIVVYLQNTPQDERFFRMFDAPFGWDWLLFHGW